MRARAIVAIDKATIELREVEIGEPATGDIVVELEFSAISAGTEAYLISLTDPTDPRIIGYAPVGRVLAAGPKAAFAVGDRVTYFAPRPPIGVSQLAGGHQTPAIVEVDASRRDLLAPDAYCVRVPDAVSSDHAAFAGISAVSYLSAELAEPSAGDKVAIIGQGVIGLFATQHFALRGAQVLAFDLTDSRLAVASECGADVIRLASDDLGAEIRTVWKDGADVIVDTTASHHAIETSISGLRREGKYVFLGVHKTPDFHLAVLQGRNVFRAYFPWALHGRLVAASLKLMSMNALTVEPLISHRFNAGQAGEAFDLVLHRRTDYTGIALDWRAPESSSLEGKPCHE